MFVNLFKDIEPLYHFTTFESAVRILASQKIRFSKMNKLNDPLESFRSISVISSGPCNEDAYEEIKIAQKELKLYQQISFSFDKKFSEGFLLNNMWGQYADKGLGVCLVFDRSLLLEGLHPKQYGAVRYMHHYDPEIVLSKAMHCNEAAIRKFVRTHIRSLFFQKKKEWEHEQEFRIVQRFDDNEDHYIELNRNWDRVLRCVIFNKTHDVKDEDTIFNSSSYSAITQLLPQGCLAAQLAKDMEGRDKLEDSQSTPIWGEFIDNNIRPHLTNDKWDEI